MRVYYTVYHIVNLFDHFKKYLNSNEMYETNETSENGAYSCWHGHWTIVAMRRDSFDDADSLGSL